MTTPAWTATSWSALTVAAQKIHADPSLHLKHLLADSPRCLELTTTLTSNPTHTTTYDYSRQQLLPSTLTTLFDLAKDVGLATKIDEMRRGAVINETENRAVLHHALRHPVGKETP